MTKTAYNKLKGKDLSISSQIRNEARVSVLPVLFNKLLKVFDYSSKTRARQTEYKQEKLLLFAN